MKYEAQQRFQTGSAPGDAQSRISIQAWVCGSKQGLCKSISYLCLTRESELQHLFLFCSELSSLVVLNPIYKHPQLLNQLPGVSQCVVLLREQLDRASPRTQGRAEHPGSASTGSSDTGPTGWQHSAHGSDPMEHPMEYPTASPEHWEHPAP